MRSKELVSSGSRNSIESPAPVFTPFNSVVSYLPEVSERSLSGVYRGERPRRSKGYTVIGYSFSTNKLLVTEITLGTSWALMLIRLLSI